MGFEPMTSAVTRQHSNHLNYGTLCGTDRIRTRNLLNANQALLPIELQSLMIACFFYGKIISYLISSAKHCQEKLNKLSNKLPWTSDIVTPMGFEPMTHGLKVRYSKPAELRGLLK